MTDPKIEAIVSQQTAPRVTEASIKERIASIAYHQIPETTLTLCVITMVNGFSVRGESACASPENFNKEVGEHYAYEDAFRKLWPLEAYLLKERMAGEDIMVTAARAAHEAIRVIQVEHNEPNVASPWDEAPQDIKDSCYIGIQRVIDNPEITSEELHDSWIETKLSQGWQYGEVRNEELKLHPCLVPYSELPSFQRLKDALFRNTVKAVLGL